jgi:iron complex transport system substrate-binding protein
MIPGFSKGRFRALAAVTTAAALMLMVPAHAQEIIVTHTKGETVLPAKPVKVVTFDFSSLEILDAMGVEVVGLPSSNVPEILAKYRDETYAKVGSLFEPDYEAVAAAEPDLIIVAGRSSPKYDDLSKIAPTIDLTVNFGDFIPAARRNTETLGRIFGKEAVATSLLADMDKAMAAVKAEAAGIGKSLFVMTNGGKVIAFGPGSRFGWLHDDLGIKAATSDIATEGSHGQAVSFEFVREQNPDLLMVLDRDRAVGGPSSGAASTTLDNELVAATKAWKSGQVVYLDPVRLYIIGASPLSITAIANQIDAMIKAKKS